MARARSCAWHGTLLFVVCFLACVISVFLFLPRRAFSATGTSHRAKWYLREPGTDCAVPFVAADGVLRPGEAAQLHAAYSGRSEGEFWFGRSDEPRDILEEAIHRLLVYDLQHILPGGVAATVAGVSWRIIYLNNSRPQHTFHFDSDEATDYAMEDIPLIHPLLSTVTYLSDLGGPTVLMNYTMADPEDPLKLPSNMWLVMPRAGKHLAFDPRLLHGVLSALRSPCVSSLAGCAGSSRDSRFVLGMNFWEVRSAESRPNEYRPGSLRHFSAAGSASEAESEVRVPTMCGAAGGQDRRVISASPGENVQRFELQTFGFGKDVRELWHPMDIFLKVPRLQLLDFEHAERGGTYDYTLDASAIEFVYDHPGRKVQAARTNFDKVAHAIAVKMLRNRCELFELNASAMNPPGAVKFCSRADEL